MSTSCAAPRRQSGDNRTSPPECRESLLAAIFQSAQCGLPVGDGTQRACLVPYGREVQFQPMFQGLIDLAYRSKQVRSICADVVFPEDKFVWNGPGRPVTHEPPWEGERDIKTALGAYAQAETALGGWIPIRMGADEIRGIRNRSKAYRAGKGPWTLPEQEPEMWKKTALRRIAKLLPKSIFPPMIPSVLEAEDARDFRTMKEAEVIISNPAPVPEAAELREQLAALTKELPPDQAEKVLDDAGIIGSLTECEDVALLSRAIEIARAK